MVYPSLFKATLPKNETDPEKARYQVSLLVPKGTDFSLLEDEIETLCVDKWGKDYKRKAKVKIPFIKTEDQPKLMDYAEDYPTLLRLNSKTKPQVVHANGGEFAEEDDVRGGRWAVVSMRPYAYEHQQGGRGVSLELINVQLWEEDEPIGFTRVSASDEFESANGSDLDSMLGS
jgi:hypothetical protein